MSVMRQTETVLLRELRRAPGGPGEARGAQVTIDGHVFPRAPVEEVVHRALGDSPIALVGRPGVGKTFFAVRGLPTLLGELFGVPYRLVYTNPFQLKSPADTFVRPSLRAGDLVWEHTWPLREVARAAADGVAVLWVIEEYTRLSPQGQNLFLELCASGTVHVEQTGEVFRLPPRSKVLLLGNTEGAGVLARHDALEDRVARVHWPLPDAHTAVEMLLAREQERGHGLRPAVGRLSAGVAWSSRPLTRAAALGLCQAAFEANEVRPEPVSLRGLERAATLYRAVPDLGEAVRRIVEGELARGLDLADVEVRRAFLGLEHELRRALAAAEP
ncbi:MAG: hypothetical protein ACYDA8_20460 [Deferrisomatales bacterium]